MVVSPDVGGVARARAFAKKLSAPLAIVDKSCPEQNPAEVVFVFYSHPVFLFYHFHLHE